MLLSIGTALCFSAMPTLIMNWVPVTETASANSLNALLRTIGTSTCAAIGGTFLAAFTVDVGGTPVAVRDRVRRSPTGSPPACSLAAAALAVAVTVAVRRAGRHRHRVADVAALDGDAERGDLGDLVA